MDLYDISNKSIIYLNKNRKYQFDIHPTIHKHFVDFLNHIFVVFYMKKITFFLQENPSCIA